MTMLQRIHRPLATAAALLLVASTAAAADPARWTGEGWKTDFSKSEIDLSEVRSGGPPKDGIPSIDDPVFLPVAEETELRDNEPVIGVEIGGEARSYPLRILMWHEIVNDTAGGVPVIVTYCPLCNAAIVFSRTVDGQPVTFGTTGKLRNSDLVMYDRATESWWQQFSGRAIAGRHAGKTLEFIPSRLESWKNFKTRHPDGMVLVPERGVRRDYGRNPYVGYDSLDSPFLYDGSLPDGIDPMVRVVVVRDADEPFAITLEKIRKEGPISRDGITLSWSEGQSSALDSAQIAEGRDVGNVMVQRDGRDIVYDVTFAFVAHAFLPDVAIETADVQ